MDWIQKIIDDSLNEMSKTEYSMRTPAIIPTEMQDESIEKMDDWNGWKPIKSIIEDTDIDKLENDIGFPLPVSYREFLKTKHFFELEIPDRAVNLPGILPDKELSFLREYVFNMMEPEFIIGQGFIYFADFQDFGLLCFDANQTVENNEYPVVYMDHENIDDIHLYAKSFRELLEADAERGNRFIEYLNELHR